MKLTQNDVARLRCWKEGERPLDISRKPDPDRRPILNRVVWDIVSNHAMKAKTARGQLRRAAQCIALVLDVLKGGA